MKEGFIVQVFW